MPTPGTSRSTAFRYDAFGRRTAVVEQDGSTATETRYLWCGERICQARDGTDTVTRRYFDEGELAVAATGDVATFYAEDHLGSIRDLRMGDGQVLASYDYDPYGNPSHVSETGGLRADYRYAGLVEHAQSGLYLAHYRAYSPTTGRWISRDPIAEVGGVNLYGYVGNNPLSYVDPTGEYGAPGIVAGAGIEAAVRAYKLFKAGCDVVDVKNYNLYDIAFAAAVGAVTPGWATVGKNSVYSARAASTLSRQLERSRTVNRASKIANRIQAHQSSMAGEIATQGAFQAGRYVVKQATAAAGANPDYNECACRE